jgi:hypothetical protein
MAAGEHRRDPGSWLGGTIVPLRDAVTITGISLVVGLLVNLVHPHAIPFVADGAYEILVPCPEPGGEVIGLDLSNSVTFTDAVFFVDARSKDEFDAWRFRQATNVPYDYLDPTPEETLQHLAKTIARSRAERVVVYGDGEVPDTGEQLAKEVSAHGIKRVFFVKGGAPRLQSLEKPGGSR